MPRFLYKAVSPDGETIEGEFDAVDRQAVVDRLHAARLEVERHEDDQPDKWPDGDPVRHRQQPDCVEQISSSSSTAASKASIAAR